MRMTTRERERERERERDEVDSQREREKAAMSSSAGKFNGLYRRNLKFSNKAVVTKELCIPRIKRERSTLKKSEY